MPKLMYYEPVYIHLMFIIVIALAVIFLYAGSNAKQIFDMLLAGF